MNSKFLKSALCLTVLCALNENVVYSSDDSKNNIDMLKNGLIPSMNNNTDLQGVPNQNSSQYNSAYINNNLELQKNNINNNQEGEKCNNQYNGEEQSNNQGDEEEMQEDYEEEDQNEDKEGEEQEDVQCEEDEKEENNITKKNNNIKQSNINYQNEEEEEEESEHEDKKTGNKIDNNKEVIISKKKSSDSSLSSNDSNNIVPKKNKKQNYEYEQENNININIAKNNSQRKINISNQNIIAQSKKLKIELRKEIGEDTYKIFNGLRKNSEVFINGFKGNQYKLDMKNMNKYYTEMTKILNDDNVVNEPIDLQLDDMNNIKEFADVYVRRGDKKENQNSEQNIKRNENFGNYMDKKISIDSKTGEKVVVVKKIYDELFKPCDEMLENNNEIYQHKYQIQQNKENIERLKKQTSNLKYKLDDELAYKQLDEETKLSNEMNSKINELQERINELLQKQKKIKTEYEGKISEVKNMISSKYRKLIKANKLKIKKLESENGEINNEINILLQKNEQSPSKDTMLYKLRRYINVTEGDYAETSALNKAYNYVELRRKLKQTTRSPFTDRINKLIEKQNSLKKSKIQNNNDGYSGFQSDYNMFTNKLVNQNSKPENRKDKINDMVKKEEQNQITEEDEKIISNNGEELNNSNNKKNNVSMKKIKSETKTIKENNKKEDSKEEINITDDNNSNE